MNKILKTLLVTFIVASCASKKASTSTKELNKTHTKGTIIDNSKLDGCTYLIVLEDHSTFEPINLDATFKQDGLQIYFLYKKSNAMSVCMAGQPITLLEIKKANP